MAASSIYGIPLSSGPSPYSGTQVMPGGGSFRQLSGSPPPPAAPPANNNSWDLNSIFSQTQGNNNNWANYSRAMGLDPGGRYEGNNAAKYEMPGQYALDTGNLAFTLQNQPAIHNAATQFLNMLQNPTQMSQDYRNQVMGQMQQHLPEIYNSLQSSGAGIGAQQGAMINANNQASSQANQYDANLFGTQGMLQRDQAINQIGNQFTPNYQGMSQLSSIENGTPRNQSGLDAVGSLFGEVAGSGAFSKGGAFGK